MLHLDEVTLAILTREEASKYFLVHLGWLKVLLVVPPKVACYLVKFTVASVTRIPPSYQVQDPGGYSYKIDVRMPSPTLAPSMIDVYTGTPLPAMAPAWTSFTQQAPVSPPITTPDRAPPPAPVFTLSPPSHPRDRPRKEVKKAKNPNPTLRLQKYVYFVKKIRQKESF